MFTLKQLNNLKKLYLFGTKWRFFYSVVTFILQLTIYPGINYIYKIDMKYVN